MPRRVYKHKILLDENMDPRQHYTQLNERFDVKHVVHDLRSAGVPDPIVYDLAVKTGRIILTQNARDFEDLVGSQEDCGVISIPPHWNPQMIDTKLLALLRRHSPGFFQGCMVSLDAPKQQRRRAA